MIQDFNSYISQSGGDPIANALEKCEKWVLRPYGVLLKMVSVYVVCVVCVERGECHDIDCMCVCVCLWAFGNIIILLHDLALSVFINHTDVNRCTRSTHNTYTS